MPLSILGKWQTEIDFLLKKSKSAYIAILTFDGEIIYANTTMITLLNGNPRSSLLNPTFDELANMEAKDQLVFEGYLTLGNSFKPSHSIFASIYRKDTFYLIYGEINADELISQNEIILQLNQENSELQRNLIIKSRALEQSNEELTKLNESISKHLLLKDQLLEELSLSEAKLKESVDTKNKFFSIIAHDLRGPFSGFLGLSSLLAKDVDELSYKEIKTMALAINKSANAVYMLIEDLLKWSMTQIGTMPFELEEVHLCEVSTNIINTLKPTLSTKEITIQNYIPQDTKLQCDRNMIQAIFRNLISNAIKFTPSEGKIEIGLTNIENSNNELSIYIKDSGIGMSADLQKKLFKIHENVSRSGTEKEAGTGFGLLLCKEFIEKHNGNIWVESEVNEGTTFYFTISANL